jgi:hypothetical protein
LIRRVREPFSFRATRHRNAAHSCPRFIVSPPSKPKAPPGCYWRGRILWGCIKVRGTRTRWSLKTGEPIVAAARFAAVRALPPSEVVKPKTRDLPLVPLLAALSAHAHVPIRSDQVAAAIDQLAARIARQAAIEAQHTIDRNLQEVVRRVAADVLTNYAERQSRGHD